MGKMKKYKFLSVFLVASFIYSCVSLSKNYGRLKIISKISKSQNESTIQDLIDKWEDYDIYYSDKYEGYNVHRPLGIMFDPKNNDTKLVGDRWKKVKSQKDLIEMTQWIYANTHFEPWLNEILGPDGRFYGYLYYSYGPVTLRVVDDKTMYVFNLDEPGDMGPHFSN